MAPSLTSTKPSLYPKSTLKSSSHTPPPSSSSSSSSTTTSNNPSFPPSSVNTFLSTPSCHVPPSISTPSPSCLNLTNNEKHHPGSSSSTHKGPPLTPTVDSAPLFTLMTTYFSYLILIVFGHVRDFLGRWFEKETTKHLRPHDGYAPLVSDFESFYSRRLYHRIRDCFARPVTKVPGAYVHVLHRHVTSSPFLSATTMTTSSSSSTTIPTTTSTSPLPTSTLTPTPTSTLFTFSTFPFKRKLHPVLPLDPVDSGTSFPSPWSSTWNGDGDGGDCGRGRGRQGGGSWSSSVTLCLNLASYNYLGFAQTEGPCASSVVMTIQQLGMNLGSTRNEVGLHQSHLLLESQVASFLGTEDAVCINMGFATNTSTLPLLVSKGCLIVSDELNHASLVFGARLSGASIQVFKHNCCQSLEKVLREAISQGQPRTHRPWKKIVVVVEGLYSMEGHYCDLPNLIRLKKKYKFYLFMDEAHSIGAIGSKGRGLCDHFNVSPNSIDILMGTFTKSFGAAGGYIAGKKSLIRHLRAHGHASLYADPLPLPVTQQILSAMHALETPSGQLRIHQLRENAVYFRTALLERGYSVLGDVGSPVIPMLIFHPGKLPAFSRMCLARNLAVVVVGAPATPIVSSRVRFCISAAHSLQELQHAIDVIDEIGQLLCLNVNKRTVASSSSSSSSLPTCL